MKILLQPEVRSLDNREIAENYQNLINLLSKISTIKPNFSNQSINKKSDYSCN
jgi:hypothetical protein